MPRRALEPTYRLAISVLRPILMLLTWRDWRGAEHLRDEGGFMVCSNHMSYVDPFALAHFLVDNGHPPYFLAKEAVFRSRWSARIIRGAGQIPVCRETGTRRRLRRGGRRRREGRASRCTPRARSPATRSCGR